MRITVLGKSPAWQDAGGACSGFLVQGGDANLLLDCGSGVFGKLRARLEYVDVDAVVISHLHADHILDLVPFASALTYGSRRGLAEPVRPLLHAPPGAREALRLLCSASGMRSEHVEAAFELREYDPAQEIQVGSLRLSFCPVAHFVPTNAVRVTSSLDGGRFTFSADTGPCDALCDFAEDSDLLLIEATLMRPEPEGPRGHLTAAEAGAHGLRARARRLVLTHVSDELDGDRVRAEAARAFAAEVELACEGAVYEI